MTRDIIDILDERGFIDQATNLEELRELLNKEKVCFYIGFDATADSLTLGHFLQVRVMQHMQRAGHIPIALLGGGTTMIGDPSGRNDMRKLMTKEFIDHNVSCFKRQLSHFLDFEDGKGYFENNADWLLNLNFLDFMREIGTEFSVNRMLTFDCYKNRMEEGLTFFEFGYMLMQSYDFLHLYRMHNCRLELGGSDQWSNMLGGYELVRKKENSTVYAMTFKLLQTADGQKMGKTAKGAVWLDKEKTPPYEMFQYLRNVDDRDALKFLKLLTLLPMEEIKKYENYEGKDLNVVKELLAYEVVKDVHGEEEAKKALEAARSVFGKGQSSDNMPTTEIDKSEFLEMTIIDLLNKTNLIKTNSEGRRLITQGGITLGEEKVKDPNLKMCEDVLSEGEVIIKKGKKVFHKVSVK